MCPDGCSGYGALRRAAHVVSCAVAELPSSSARWIAPTGRQKSKWYLSFQQLIAASAALRFIIANRRALSARLTLWVGLVTRFRATKFHVCTGVLCQNIAICVWSVVRVVA